MALAAEAVATLGGKSRFVATPTAAPTSVSTIRSQAADPAPSAPTPSTSIALIGTSMRLSRRRNACPTAIETKIRRPRLHHSSGTTEAKKILRSGNRRVLAGSVGYWAFDNAVLWATFHSVGVSPPLTVVLMGYLIGQLGGLLPIPGGIGGIDGGLIGTLVVYGAPAAGTAAAVLGYRLILFWLPLIVGAMAFGGLRRDMPRGGELASCAPAIAAQSA